MTSLLHKHFPLQEVSEKALEIMSMKQEICLKIILHHLTHSKQPELLTIWQHLLEEKLRQSGIFH
jgi:hypothetical protein